jgi:DNA-binding NarL/FixJ family response regulator
LNLTAQLPAMRETLQRSRSELRRRRCLIASADRVLITSVVALFDGIGPLVGVTSSEADALSCLERTPADLLICSDLLESGDGPSLVQQARALHPQLICLMLIQRPLRSTIEAATAAGCQGLCSRDLVGNGHLLKALQAIDSDAIYIDPVIAGVLRHSRLSPSGHRLNPGLTLREEDVLRGICRGFSNQEIADELNLSIDTVKHSVTAVLCKLDARDRSQAMLIAFRNDLVDLPARLPRWTP